MGDSGGLAAPSGQSRLAGQVAIIAGAGAAIGRGIALRLAGEEAKIALVDADLDAAAQTAAALAQAGAAAAVLGPAPVDRKAAGELVADAMARFGRIDVLVAAADYRSAWAPLAEKSAACFALAFRSFDEALWLMQAVQPVMLEGGGGSIIVLGSTCGHFTQPWIADYLAAKEATKALVRSAAQEWGPWAIRVNLLEAAAEDEDFAAYRRRRGSAAVDAALAVVPIPRRGDPVRDVGGAALFLASADSRYLTGEVIHADGGEHLATPVQAPDFVTERV